MCLHECLEIFAESKYFFAKIYIFIIIIFISELKNACSIIHSILSKDTVAEDLGWCQVSPKYQQQWISEQRLFRTDTETEGSLSVDLTNRPPDATAHLHAKQWTVWGFHNRFLSTRFVICDLACVLPICAYLCIFELSNVWLNLSIIAFVDMLNTLENKFVLTMWTIQCINNNFISF